MGMADEIIRRSKENDRKLRSDEWSKRVYNDPTNPANRYRMSMEEDTVNRMADAENKRKLALVDREQVGRLDVQKVATSGDLKKQALVNRGDMDTWNAKLREGGRQFDASLGFDQKNKDRDFDLQREKDKFDQFAKLRGLDSQDDMLGGGDGAKPNLSQDWFKYRESSSGLTDKDMGVSIAHTLATGGKLSEAQSDWARAQAGGGAASENASSMRYDTVTREDGTVESYDQLGNRVPSQVNNNSAAPIVNSKGQPTPPIKKRKIPTYIPENAMPRPFGESFIHSNIGHALGVDKAHNIATGFNRAATGAWDLSNKAGNIIIERGIKPAAKWATQEYDDPYRKK
jgi:hypothetical protein